LAEHKCAIGINAGDQVGQSTLLAISFSASQRNQG
jgi:hypothetical protein